MVSVWLRLCRRVGRPSGAMPSCRRHGAPLQTLAAAAEPAAHPPAGTNRPRPALRYRIGTGNDTRYRT